MDLQFIHSNLISCLQICKYNAYQQRWEWSHLQLDWVMNWWWKQADGNKRRRVGKMWSHWALPVYKQPPLPRKNVKYFMYHFKKCLQKLFNLNELSATRGAQLQLWNDRWHIWMNISVEEIKANTCTKMCAMSLSLQKSQKQP